MFYEYNGQLYVDANNEFNIVAKIIGAKPVESVAKPFQDLIQGEVIVDGRFLTVDEVEEEYNRWSTIYEKYFDNSDSFNKYDLIKDMKKYIFVVNCSYRDGEIYRFTVFRVDEDPQDRVAEYDEYSEYWGCNFNTNAQQLYDVIRELYERVNSD